MIELVTGTPEELRATVEREAVQVTERERLALERAARNRLLFLDFDGVLNHGAFFSEQNARGLDSFADGQCFDRACVERLNGVLAETGALVVVSSSWRIGRDIGELRRLLREHGFVGEVVGRTPHDPQWYRARGAEIRAWLRSLPAANEHFVAVDDDNDMVDVRGHLVKTRFHGGGLTDEKTREVVDLFEELG